MKEDRSFYDLTLLFVDDEIIIRESFAALLSGRVKKLFIAKDGVEALNIFEQHKPDLVVSDIIMPNLNGIELGRAIKKTPPRPFLRF